MVDISDYCRQVEAHLTRVNGGHLVRVVGPGFALVRQWAEDGVPLSAVFKGIEQKAERHKAGAARRPLRIEFCEADVREVHEAWKRAIGVFPTSADEPAETERPETGSRRRPVSRILDRALERLGRLAGRLELPDDFREAASQAIEQLAGLREALAGTRGAAREPLLNQLPEIDRHLVARAQAALPRDVLDAMVERAEAELAGYKGRLTPDAWTKAVAVTVEREVRMHFDLPNLEST